MNRRNFFKNLLVAGAGFSILPPATTYSRIWRATKPLNLVPFWYQTAIRGLYYGDGYADQLRLMALRGQEIVWPTINDGIRA